MNINEQAAGQLIEYLNSGSNFIAAQAPAVANEIIQWSLFMRWAGVFMGLTLLVVGAVILKSNWENWISEGFKELAMFPIAGMFIGSILTLCNAFMLVKIIMAPKLFLLSYIANNLA